MDNHIQIGHDTRIGKNVLIGAHSAIAGVVVIEDNCLIWSKVSINKDLVAFEYNHFATLQSLRLNQYFSELLL